MTNVAIGFSGVTYGDLRGVTSDLVGAEIHGGGGGGCAAYLVCGVVANSS